MDKDIEEKLGYYIGGSSAISGCVIGMAIMVWFQIIFPLTFKLNIESAIGLTFYGILTYYILVCKMDYWLKKVGLGEDNLIIKVKDKSKLR